MARRTKSSRLQYTPQEVLENALRDAYEYEKEEAPEYGLQIEISFAEFSALALSPCSICNGRGSIPLTSRRKRTLLDRSDRLKGFTTANSIAVCRRCYLKRRK